MKQNTHGHEILAVINMHCVITSNNSHVQLI